MRISDWSSDVCSSDLQGLSLAEVALQNAVIYAGERRQGRALTGPADPEEKADTLFVHPDVRRMLMEGKALTDGLRALCLWGALQVDLIHIEIGRASCRERVCQYVSISVGAVSFKTKKINESYTTTN